MARSSPQIKIQEIGGDRFASLQDAQRAARVYIAADLANIVQSLIASGLLEIKDGRITPRCSHD
jgi:hypothetical protein